MHHTLIFMISFQDIVWLNIQRTVFWKCPLPLGTKGLLRVTVPHMALKDSTNGTRITPTRSALGSCHMASLNTYLKAQHTRKIISAIGGELLLFFLPSFRDLQKSLLHPRKLPHLCWWPSGNMTGTMNLKPLGKMEDHQSFTENPYLGTQLCVHHTICTGPDHTNPSER